MNQYFIYHCYQLYSLYGQIVFCLSSHQLVGFLSCFFFCAVVANACIHLYTSFLCGHVFSFLLAIYIGLALLVPIAMEHLTF